MRRRRTKLALRRLSRPPRSSFVGKRGCVKACRRRKVRVCKKKLDEEEEIESVKFRSNFRSVKLKRTILESFFEAWWPKCFLVFPWGGRRLLRTVFRLTNWAERQFFPKVSQSIVLLLTLIVFEFHRSVSFERRAQLSTSQGRNTSHSSPNRK